MRKSRVYYLAVAVAWALLVAAVDQAVKGLVVATLQNDESRRLLPGILDLSYQRNTGAAFSMWTQAPVAAMIGMNLLVLGVFLALIYPHLRRRGGMIAAVLVLGGALGNLIDRLCRHYVVDYLDLFILRVPVFDFASKSFHVISWPVFNIADLSIVIGVIMLVLTIIVAERQTSHLKESHADAANAH